MSRRTKSRQYRLWKRVLQVRLPHPHLTSRNQPLLLFETPYKERLVSQWLAPIQANPQIYLVPDSPGEIRTTFQRSSQCPATQNLWCGPSDSTQVGGLSTQPFCMLLRDLKSRDSRGTKRCTNVGSKHNRLKDHPGKMRVKQLGFQTRPATSYSSWSLLTAFSVLSRHGHMLFTPLPFSPPHTLLMFFEIPIC